MSDDTTPRSAKDLLILALDHRHSLQTKLYGIEGTPTPDEAARIAADKLLVYRGLLDAVERMPERTRPGILVDEQYGASVAELAKATGGAMDLSMPLEASGEELFRFEYGDAWRQHAEFFAPDHVKVLVRDNPAHDESDRASQAARLAQISLWAHQGDHRFLFELLVPATDEQLASVDGDTRRYDDELRPGLTLEVMRYLQDHGVEPAVWKVEGLDSADDARRIAETAARDDRDADCIVLGRHASAEDLDRWLETAAPIPGFDGFAIGRSIWWDALEDHLKGSADDAEVRRRVADAYSGFADDWARGREKG